MRSPLALVCVLLFFAVWGSSVIAQDVQYTTSISALLEKVEANQREIAALREQVNANQQNVPSEEEMVFYTDSQSGWFGGAELLLLKAHTIYSSPDEPNDYQPSSRLWIGRQFSGGFGARFRWFNFAQNIDGPITPDDFMVTRLIELQVNNFDFEATDSAQWGSNWFRLVSAGIRYTNYVDLYRALIPTGSVPFALDYRNQFAGVGPTAGIQLNRILGNGYSWFIGAQQSFVFGRATRSSTTSQAPIISHHRDQVLAVSELQTGFEYSRSVGDSTAEFFIRGAIEGQYYFTDVGLFGGVFAVGIRR